MYLPPLFREDRLDVQHEVIRRHPLGLLVTAGSGGLMANAIPFLIAPELSEFGTLQAHLARANNQWRELADVDECMVVFQGPDAYVTPSWYATKRESGKVVPTWNYVTVHAWGRPHVIEEVSWLREQIGALTDGQEEVFAEPWAVSDAPETFIAGQIKGIVGLEIPISRIEGKWKVSQNRPHEDRTGVIEGFTALGADGREMAALVRERLTHG